MRLAIVGTGKLYLQAVQERLADNMESHVAFDHFN
jgi:hypothetical protein